MKKLSIILVLLILAPVLAQAQVGNESAADVEDESTAGAENESTTSVEYFENQEEMKEKATDILEVIMRIVRDVLIYIQKTLSEMPLTE